MDHPKFIADIDSFLSSHDRKHQSVVFTNGCFDLLHKGHLHLLHEAKKQGDILIVAVNDDASVKQLKGASRPVEPLAVRMRKLAELPEADFIIPFSEETPLSLIEKIQPDVLVKGGDYKKEDIAGNNIAGKVVIIPLLEGFSTTNSISSGQ